MRGKFVNLGFGVINIVFGLLIIVFHQYVPQDVTDLTIQQMAVQQFLAFAIKLILIVILIINIIALYNNRTESNFKSSYRIGIFSVIYFILPNLFVSILPILSGILIIKNVLKENLIQLDSTAVLSIILVILAILGLIILGSLKYQDIAEYIYDKQNEGMQEYSKTFFKYITPIETEDVYINVKNNGKYGYINQKGETVIDFKYDYASPFIKIVQYNKEFEVALVCKDSISYIIMKNERIVKSYITESANEDYSLKIAELERFYKEELGQTDEMKYEIKVIDNNIRKIKPYSEEEIDYTYKYDFTDKYDLGIISSSLGLSDTYYLIKKDNEKIRIELKCEKLDYDDDYLYIYSNGYLPYYSLNNREQGWFNESGHRVTMQGKAQILELINGNMLFKNYNDNTIYFMDGNQQIISSIYKDIYVGNNNEYVVQNTNGKYTLIDSQFSQIINEEFDFINTSMAEYGLYVCGNFEEEIDISDYNYYKTNFKLINSNGTILMENIEQIYDVRYMIDENIKNKEEQINKLKEDIKGLDYKFVGEKFYEKYK